MCVVHLNWWAWCGVWKKMGSGESVLFQM